MGRVLERVLIASHVVIEVRIEVLSDELVCHRDVIFLRDGGLPR